METLEKLLNVQTKVMLVTPEIAKNWLTANTMNRKMDDGTVNYYADQMKKDFWTLSPDAITFSDTHKLLNGQHRLRAVVVSGKSVYMSVTFSMPEECFKNIDRPKVRSNGDVLQMHGIKYSRMMSAGISKYHALRNNLVARNACKNIYAAPTSANSKLSITDILNTYKSMPEVWDETALAADRYYSKFRYFGQSDYLAYIVYLTKWKNHPQEKVNDFFTQLSHGGTYVKNQTIQLLRDKLTENAISKTKMTGLYRNAIITKTWNAFVTGREVQRFFFNPNKEQKTELL
jgi:hypothetical protein